ncbi:hypothetical protein A3C59_00650 [Candidatus Daviesbacteria bacterium RIFCSPHIGHO2_02_FULL_36_13]|uniref:Glycosyl transferase family 1 domain-containing protein n=1 Tax=Candidatus Daviesbacteria bacterium RIFCSPHIGHO2_02_FULL_36_13 TaxID=1797768 RepID=A0A1F5JPB6_9BACT|nr:MAG: hypothetical protein A3C59_00650 [Candidatus Daviesbacteria bacterium RIFCSPHIGHO2_02_FULL_36_13]
MKAALYSPYLDTLGGGEKYMMTIAEILSSEHEVDVLLDLHLKEIGAENLKKELSERFSLELDKVNFISGPIGKGSNTFERLSFFKKYQVFFCLTDGSFFYPSAKKNILHIQSPLVGQAANSLFGKIKLKGWDLIIYNSEFTKDKALKNWPLAFQVIYPPVDTKKITSMKKNKQILSVGRFASIKKQDVLINTFKELINDGKIKEWNFNLVGSAGEGDKAYLEGLKNLAKGSPINFYPNLSYEELLKLYGESSIYWHAAGFGEDDPTKMEHFGISTVEAMAGGCVPVVIKKGGQIEIVEEGKSGFLWDSLDELKDLTIKLIQDKTIWQALSKEAMIRAEQFSKEKFRQKILNLL